MKTKIIIEIESPDSDKMNLYDIETGKDKSKKEHEIYAKELHRSLINQIEAYFGLDNEHSQFEEWWIDGLEELSCEDYDSFEDYSVKVDLDIKSTSYQT